MIWIKWGSLYGDKWESFGNYEGHVISADGGLMIKWGLYGGISGSRLGVMKVMRYHIIILYLIINMPYIYIAGWLLGLVLN